MAIVTFIFSPRGVPHLRTSLNESLHKCRYAVDVSRMTELNIIHGPLARYVKSRVAHAPGMPGTFSPPPRVSDPDMHHGTCVMHVPWGMPGSLTSEFLWSRWRGKRSRLSRRMLNQQFYVSGKRPMLDMLLTGDAGLSPIILQSPKRHT